MKRLRLLFLLALTPLSVHAAIFSGVVLDSQGASIHKAYVVIRWDSVGIDGVKENLGTNEIKTTTTDETGHFSLELPAGLYDIFVSAAGFFSTLREDRGRSNRETPLQSSIVSE